MIKRIELVNFMSHERTVIEPANGLTVLVGPNNCGKSAFVTALQILCHNAKSSYVLRHGAKECEIIVETDDGHIVKWSRKKSGSPKYVINGEEFDRLRGGIPSELHAILGLDKVNCEKDQFDVHFGEQKSPIFLLDDSGKAAAQFFASSSDAIRLVEMQDRHKSKVRDAKRDHSRLTSEKHDLESDLEILEPIESIEENLAQCESQFDQIQKSEEQTEALQILIKAIEETNHTLEHQDAILNVVADLEEPPELGDCDSLDRLIAKQSKLTNLNLWAQDSGNAFANLTEPPILKDENSLAQLLANLQNAEKDSRRVEATTAALHELNEPPKLGDENELEEIIFEFKNATRDFELCEAKFNALNVLQPTPELADVSELAELLSDLSKTSDQLEHTSSQLKQLESEFEDLNSDVETWVDSNPTCPTCGSETKVEELLGSVTGQRGCHG